MDIKVIKIREPICGLYDPLDRFVGEITTHLELNDVRLQIKENQAEGYYILWDDMRININFNGKLDKWPDDFYDQSYKQVQKLIVF